MYAKGQGVEHNKEKSNDSFSDAADLLREPGFYNQLKKEMGSERVNLNYIDAKNAFVKYQYSKFVDENKTINLEQEYSEEVAEIAKKISEKIIGRCWE